MDIFRSLQKTRAIARKDLSFTPLFCFTVPAPLSVNLGGAGGIKKCIGLFPENKFLKCIYCTCFARRNESTLATKTDEKRKKMNCNALLTYKTETCLLKGLF